MKTKYGQNALQKSPNEQNYGIKISLDSGLTSSIIYSYNNYICGQLKRRL